LSEAFNTLLRRHDALRMSFEELDGEIVASISEDAAVDLPVRDLTASPASERMTEALRLATGQGARPFVLSEAPLLRLLLLRLDTREHLLVLLLHHIVTDGWSMSIIFDEIAEEQHHRGAKLRIGPMLGFKWFRTAAITIARVELLRRIHKDQFDLRAAPQRQNATCCMDGGIGSETNTATPRGP
jgi:NRPS condensation-like uncharacterized protein